jgi:Lipocalin-like domain
MEKKSVLIWIVQWLKTTEMFARPSKLLPGKWQLFEYYFDSEKELNHITEQQLNAAKESWIIEFTEEENYIQQSQLSLSLISKIENGTWSISRNYVTLIHPDNFRNNIEFQFAIEKGILKLLKKNAFGKIEFFGFFKNQN